MKKLILVTCSLILIVACQREASENLAELAIEEDAIILEIQQIADQFIAYQPMQGFAHTMTLEQAYIWQDRLAEYMKPVMGPVIGYKTGGHDPGPGFATFPPGGIRGLILEGMVYPSGTEVSLYQTRRGFLEADFAVRVGSAKINEAETDLEILAALDAIMPFAEIPDPYYEDGTRSVTGTIVANMGSRMSFSGEPLLLAPTQDWLNKINNFTFVVHDEHGIEVATGSMSNWYRPLTVVRWLRDQVLDSGKKLKPGQILSLGNIGIIRQLHEGSPRGPAYESNEFILSYIGLSDEPASVTIKIARQ
ncbi:MAG: 2-keto-4-pentenoate hydratase [Candidatus Azotimanducaceae bacterium]|jgi:2-keto-4-pentenoate hydratase